MFRRQYNQLPVNGLIIVSVHLGQQNAQPSLRFFRLQFIELFSLLFRAEDGLVIEGAIMILPGTVVMVSGTEGSVGFPLSAFLLSDAG